MNESRYQTPAAAAKGNTSEYAFVNLRYKLPGESKSILISQPVPATSKALSQADANTRFALAVTAYGQALRGGEYNGKMGWNDIISLAQNSANPDPYDLRKEFIELAKVAQSLSTKASE